LLFITTRLTAVVRVLTHPYEQWAGGVMNSLFPSANEDADGRAIVPHAYVYYAKNLLPEVVLITSLQLCYACVFVAVEGVDFGIAFYHCMITATTVGYGALPGGHKSDGGYLWAVVHILLSVTMLGNAIAFFDTLRVERSKELKRVEALNRSLDQTLLETIELRAAALRPEVQRGNEGVSELEFVICMAVELGMVEMKQLQPFLNQFRALDVLGNGRLGMKDLQAQKKLAQQLHLHGAGGNRNSFGEGSHGHVASGDGEQQPRLGDATQASDAREAVRGRRCRPQGPEGPRPHRL